MKVCTLLIALTVGMFTYAYAAPASNGASAKDEKEVTAAMESYRNAMVRKDGATLEKLFHKDLTYSHSNGRLEDKAEAIKNATSGPNVAELMEFSDHKTRVYGNTALVRGDVRVKTSSSDLKLSVLHVWLKGPQGWQLVGRQSTRYIAP